MRHILRWGLIALLALAVGGCLHGGDGSDGPTPTVESPTDDSFEVPEEPDRPPDEGTLEIPAESTDPPVLGETDLDEALNRAARQRKVLDDAGALGPMLNEFWAEELRRHYSLTFDPVLRLEYYRGAQPTSCGGKVGPRANNAYYCFADNEEHVAFDLDWFQQFLERHPAGATTFLVLAHEWGHAVQDEWLESGGGDYWRPPNRQELNADCLAGVFLAAKIADGSIVEEEGDADAIFSWLYAGGSSPWLAPGTHGTREERQEAFADGYANGTPYCRETY